MRWKNLEGQGNVEDRRSLPGGRAGKVGGVGVIGIVAVLISLFLGGGESVDLGPILEGLQPPTAPAAEVELTAEESEYAAFATAIVGNLDLVWTDVFSEAGLTYHPPRLVLFREATTSGCGGARSAIGPHYCPSDQTIYLDETFFDAVLEVQLGGSGGDFAEAYVIAHEVGHHVQNELNISTQVRQAQQEDPDSANALSVLLELQADCFAGVWAFTLADQGNVLDRQDVQEAIDAAATVGDDRIQEKTTGRVNPEGWTHGSSEQRVEHFMIGFNTGDANQCDTFS